MNRDTHPVENLSGYLDDALSPGERAAVESHLAECPSCARLLDDLRTLTRDVRNEGIPEAPAGLAGRIGRALDGGSPRGKVVPFRLPWKIPVSVAATLGAAALLVIAYRFLPPPSVPIPPEPPPAEQKSLAFDVPAEAHESIPPPSPSPAPESVAEPAAPAPPARQQAAEKSAAAVVPMSDARRRDEGMVLAEADRFHPAPPCLEGFRPFEGTLTRIGPAPAEAIAGADRAVVALGGRIVIGEGDRLYAVRAADWGALRESLRRAGFVSVEEPRPVPPDAECVLVRVAARAETP